MKKIETLENGKLRVTTVNEEPSLTQQQFHDQTDVNAIMRKYHKSGMIDHLNLAQGQYIDLSSVPDYQTALQTVIDADKAFMTIPSNVRRRFNNNPAELIQFLQDPNNAEEAYDLGLTNSPPFLEESNPTQPLSPPPKSLKNKTPSIPSSPKNTPHPSKTTQLSLPPSSED